MNRNYQRELEGIIERNQREGKTPHLLLHSCCAPCSSYVLEYLSRYFKITVFYYNPNIYPEEEYRKRVWEQRQLIEKMPLENEVDFIEGEYEKERFHQMSRGLEGLPEGGERCFRCYALRLEEAAALAKKLGCDWFTTTLSISPMKNAKKLNEIGEELGRVYEVNCLPSDFKKKDGYKRSVELSKTFGLYRQDYCGCVFSKREREGERQRGRRL